jgi:hypothetical protein
VKIKKLIKSTFDGEGTDSVTLTITSSKRLHLFKQTISSFVEHCQDKLLISKIILFDDSSTEDDRFEMERLVEKYFPDRNIDFIYFNDIPTKYRHAYIMQHWFTTLKTNFVFHLEDDWLFLDGFSLRESVDILKDDWSILSVGFAQSLREFTEDYLALYKAERIRTNRSEGILYPKQNGYWIWPYLPQYPVADLMFDDAVASREGSQDLNTTYWERFLNWPPFGLRPCVIDVVKLQLIGNFNFTFDVDANTPLNMEGSYGKRAYPQFDAINTVIRKVKHIGNIYMNEPSAYDLNNSNR